MHRKFAIPSKSAGIDFSRASNESGGNSRQGKQSDRRGSLAREYLESLIVAVLIALTLRFFVIAAYKIPTGSMVPTLKVGNFIFAYKLPYGIPIPFSKARLGTRLPQPRGSGGLSLSRQWAAKILGHSAAGRSHRH